MADYALLIGNDINNVVAGNSWSDLLYRLTNHLSIKVDFHQDKPFPLAYEEIYFKTVKNTSHSEEDIKKYVAQQATKIKHGEIHQAILELGVTDILTTNYDLSLEDASGYSGTLSNKGYISETKYSLFRKHIVQDTNIWHIHGSAIASNSITLGYEHYSGYLQHMRSYVVTGTKDTYKKRSFSPLTKRIKQNKVEFESWVDLFFTKDIHIFGLSLDFVETDIWWLLTFREKSRYSKNLSLNNKIYYYIPEELTSSSKSKIEMMESLGIVVVSTIGYERDKISYYSKVISRIKRMYA